MLVAKLANGVPFSLTDRWPKEKLVELKKTMSFFCPVCNGPVILKLGTKKQWHFAHLKESALCKSFEQESDRHLLGKKQLFRWLKKQNLSVHLEKYLPSIKQRPDLFYEQTPKKVAIEYQCSPIHFDLHYKRTLSYLQQKIYPLWIIGANQLQRKGAYFFNLHPFEWSSTFLIKSEMHPVLMYYCPEKEEMIVLKQLVSITKNKVFAQMISEKLSNLSSFRELLMQKPETTIFSHWLELKKHWRYSITPYPSKAQQFFYSYCYERRLSPFYYPAESGWPLKHASLIQTPLYIWQSWIVYEFLLNKKGNDPISFQEVYHAFKQKVAAGIFQIRILPLTNAHYSFAIMNYLQLLCDFQVLQKVSRNLFVMKREITPMDSLEALFALEKKYISEIKC